MKKVLALLLVVLMAVSVLAACGDDKKDNQNTITVDVTKDDDGGSTAIETLPPSTEKGLTQEKLIGDWTMAISMSKAMDAYIETLSETEKAQIDAMMTMLEAMFDGVDVKMNITFNEGNKYTVITDESAIPAMKDQMIDNMMKYLRNGGIVELMKLSTGQELTVEEIEAMVAQENMTMDEFYKTMAESLNDSIDVSKMTDSITEKDGEYKLTEDTLWIDADIDELDVKAEFNFVYKNNTITLTKQVEGKSHPLTGAVLTKK